MHHQDHRIGGDQRDRRQLVQRISRLAVEQFVRLGNHRRYSTAPSAAVYPSGLRVGHRGIADCAPGARAIRYRHRLLECFLQRNRCRAAGNVGHAARRETAPPSISNDPEKPPGPARQHAAIAAMAANTLRFKMFFMLSSSSSLNLQRIRQRSTRLTRRPTPFDLANHLVARLQITCRRGTTSLRIGFLPPSSASLPQAVPPGVPVEMITPGCSVTKVEKNSTSCAQVQIIFPVVLLWRSSPLTQVRRSSACGSRISSAVTIAGPIGAQVSKFLPGPRL